LFVDLPESMLTRRKKILFSIIPALMLLLLLGLTEFGLRLFAPSLASPLAAPVTADSVEWWQINRRYLAKYFPADIVLLPEFKPTLFRKQKAPGAYRIFCLGESSMFGTPYQMNATIPAMVRTQLRRLFPGREIEVINLGASAINSNVIADIAPQVAEFEPDLILIYTGHNEFYGPDGVGASWLEKHLPFLTDMGHAIRDLRLSALIGRLFSGRKGEAGEGMMKAVSQGQQIALGSEDAERVFHRFDENLQQILGTFRERKIPVVISDVSSNLRFPPFIAPPVHEIPDVAGAFGREGAALLPRLQAARAAHPANAALAYWAGRCFEAVGRMDSARALMREARDLDLLKFRAPQKINEIIWRVAVRESTPCVSADSLFESMSEGNVPGENLFWEHLHPRARGYFGIAELFLGRMASLGLLPSGGPGTGTRARFNADTLAIPWLDLAYADLSMKHLTTRWPFENFQITPEVMPGADGELQTLAADVYTRKMNWDEGCYRTALSFRRLGRPGDALTTYRALIEDYPRNAYAHYLAATVYKDGNDFPMAEREYAASIAMNPSSPFAHLDFGLMLINAGRFDEAISRLDAGLRLTGERGAPAMRATAMYGLAAAYANKGDYPRALQLIDQSIALSPDYEPALTLREGLRRAHR
jgi:tetratricopeptide (TPR) repeat protein